MESLQNFTKTTLNSLYKKNEMMFDSTKPLTQKKFKFTWMMPDL